MPIPTFAIAHVNLNCRDLELERAFFEGLGMRAVIHTDPAAQDCSAFGFEGDGQWDAWMLQDDRETPGTALDLLEWKEPRPIAHPPRPGTRPGFERLGFTAPDLAAAREAVLARGGWASEIHELDLGSSATGTGRRNGFGATSPEGQALLVLEADGKRLAHVGVGCSDLSRSEAFYAEVFGMKARAALTPGPLPAEVFQPGPEARGLVTWEGRLLDSPHPEVVAGAPHPFHVVLTQWSDPEPAGLGLAEPNHVGIFRMAFLVQDIDAAHDELASLGVSGLSPVVTLDLGPSCPAPDCSALFFRDPDGICLELIETPRPAEG